MRSEDLEFSRKHSRPSLLIFRRKNTHPYIEGYRQKIKMNYETEKYIASKNNHLLNFYNKWPENIPL